MGASFVTHELPGNLTEKEVKDRFEQMQDEDRYENGHSYSGGIGMARGLKFRRDVTFATFAEAENWLDNNAEKWEAALCVRVTDDPPSWVIGAVCSS